MDKINKNRLDPVTMYATDKILLILTREELEFPPRNANDEDDVDEEEEGEETDEERRDRLIKVLHEQCIGRLGANCGVLAKQHTAPPEGQKWTVQEITYYWSRIFG